jgi:microcin C transport system ATP-binding protein
VVGESGSGKTTLGLALLRLIDSTGEVRFLDQRIDGLSRGAMRPLRRQMQVIFQDPFGSLSPRLSIVQIVGEGLEVHDLEKCREELGARVAEALSDVGLDPGAMHRYPHEFSGGQRQRISIARALVLRPTFVVLDEPTSALDVSVQAQMIELLLSLQEKYDLTYLFISHDLRVVRALSDDILVMKDGQLVETGSAARVFDYPEHAYTQALLSASVDLRTRSL